MESFSLPPEIILEIARRLPIANCKAFRQTCSAVSAAVDSVLFEKIRVSLDGTDSAHQEIIDKHGKHVREIILDFSLYPNIEYELASEGKGAGGGGDLDEEEHDEEEGEEASGEENPDHHDAGWPNRVSEIAKDIFSASGLFNCKIFTVNFLPKDDFDQGDAEEGL